jgi:hypothetical protein
VIDMEAVSWMYGACCCDVACGSCKTVAAQYEALMQELILCWSKSGKLLKK